MLDDYFMVSSPRRGRRSPRSYEDEDMDDRGWTLLHIGARKGDLKEDTMTAATKIGHAAYKGPSVMKEILFGIALGIAAGGLWNMNHWNNQRRTKEFYDLLEKGRRKTVCTLCMSTMNHSI